MDASGVFESVDKKFTGLIRRALGEDEKPMEALVQIFKEWLKSETYLPKDVDQRFIENYIRHCKYDVELTKKKFEDYLASRGRIRKYLGEGEHLRFDDIMLHRQAVPLPKLTPEGYRMGIAIFPEDIKNFDFTRLLNYTITMLDFIGHQDLCTGYVAVFDLKNFSAEYLGKINLELLVENVNLVYNVVPYKTFSTHFLNLPNIPDIIISSIKRLLSSEALKTVYIHKTIEGFANQFPKDMLPVEYGGTAGTINELADRTKEYFLSHDFKCKCETLKYSGPLPYNKRDQVFEEPMQLPKNIRNLNID